MSARKHREKESVDREFQSSRLYPFNAGNPEKVLERESWRGRNLKSFNALGLRVVLRVWHLHRETVCCAYNFADLHTC